MSATIATPKTRLLVPVSEVATMLSIGESTVWAWVKNNKLPAPIKIGGATRWRVSEILTHKQSQSDAALKVVIEDIIDMPIDGSGFHLYRHFDKAGVLLYIGVSLSAVARLAQHQSNAAWFQNIARVEICNYATREASLRAEQRAIRVERPLHNIIYSIRRVA